AVGLIRSALAIVVPGGRRIRGLGGGCGRRRTRRFGGLLARFLGRLLRGLLGFLFRGLLGGLLGLFVLGAVIGGGRRRHVGVLGLGTRRELLHRQALHGLGHVLGPDVGRVTAAVDLGDAPEAFGHRHLLAVLADLVHRHRGGDLRDETAEPGGLIVVGATRLTRCGAAQRGGGLTGAALDHLLHRVGRIGDHLGVHHALTGGVGGVQLLTL